jgi:hypothetical protein
VVDCSNEQFRAPRSPFMPKSDVVTPMMHRRLSQATCQGHSVIQTIYRWRHHPSQPRHPPQWWLSCVLGYLLLLDVVKGRGGWGVMILIPRQKLNPDEGSEQPWASSMAGTMELWRGPEDRHKSDTTIPPASAFHVGHADYTVERLSFMVWDCPVGPVWRWYRNTTR